MRAPGIDADNGRRGDDRAYSVFTVRDGRIVALRDCRDRQEALRLTGVQLPQLGPLRGAGGRNDLRTVSGDAGGMGRVAWVLCVAAEAIAAACVVLLVGS